MAFFKTKQKRRKFFMPQIIYYESPGCASGGFQVKTDADKAVVRLSVGFEKTLMLEVPIDVDPRTYSQLRDIERYILEKQQAKDRIPEQIYFKEEEV